MGLFVPSLFGHYHVWRGGCTFGKAASLYLHQGDSPISYRATCTQTPSPLPILTPIPIPTTQSRTPPLPHYYLLPTPNSSDLLSSTFRSFTQPLDAIWILYPSLFDLSFFLESLDHPHLHCSHIADTKIPPTPFGLISHDGGYYGY